MSNGEAFGEHHQASSKEREGERQEAIQESPQPAATELPELSGELLELAVDKGSFDAYFEQQRTLPPDADIRLYHGMNGSYDAALELVTSEHRGVEERRGPTLSLTPLAQYWKEGDVGVAYTLPRRLVQFPGEENPDAVVRLDSNNVAHILTPERTLPFTQYKGEVIRAPETPPNPDKEAEIQRVLERYAKVRTDAAYLEQHIGSEAKREIFSLLEQSRALFDTLSLAYVRDGIHERGHPLGKWSSERNMRNELSVTGPQVEGEVPFGETAEQLLPEITNIMQQIEQQRDAVASEIAQVEDERESLADMKERLGKRGILPTFGLGRQRFIAQVTEAYRGSDPEFLRALTQAVDQSRPWETLERAINEREAALAVPSSLAKRREVYDQELETYGKLEVQLRSVIDMTRRAIDATHGRESPI